MAMKVEMNTELEERIDRVINAVKEKQDQGRIELYRDEMQEMLDTYGEYDLLLTGCRMVRSSWRQYLILPEEYIEDQFIPSLKTQMAMAISKEESK